MSAAASAAVDVAALAAGLNARREVVLATATRYVGSLKLIITLGEDGMYSIRIVELDDAARFDALDGVQLSIPMRESHVAADSAEALDDVARVAIGFAGCIDERVYEFVSFTDAGDEVEVRRSRSGELCEAAK